jgi:hypothetical protein
MKLGVWIRSVYIAMKAGQLTGHQTHGDLDAGDFVLDALGQRWAGEYGSGGTSSLSLPSPFSFSPGAALMLARFRRLPLPRLLLFGSARLGPLALLPQAHRRSKHPPPQRAQPERRWYPDYDVPDDQRHAGCAGLYGAEREYGVLYGGLDDHVQRHYRAFLVSLFSATVVVIASPRR